MPPLPPLYSSSEEKYSRTNSTPYSPKCIKLTLNVESNSAFPLRVSLQEPEQISLKEKLRKCCLSNAA